MKKIFSTLFLILFASTVLSASLTGCTPAQITPTPESPTPTTSQATETSTSISPSPSAMPSIAPSETSVPPVTLDKPMTTEFNPTKLDVMPSANEEMVTSGQLSSAVVENWKTTGFLNQDGTLKNQTNVVPAEPDGWHINISPGLPSAGIPGGDIYLVGEKLTKDWSQVTPNDIPFQSTNFQFKLLDGSGNIKGVLYTEALYYKDGKGQIRVLPVFFFVDKSKLNNTFKPIITEAFGHSTEKRAISSPFVGVEKGKTGQVSINPLFQQADNNAYINDPIEASRIQIANDIVANKDPQGIQNVWWAPSFSDFAPQ